MRVRDRYRRDESADKKTSDFRVRKRNPRSPFAAIFNGLVSFYFVINSFALNYSDCAIPRTTSFSLLETEIIASNKYTYVHNNRIV